MPTTTVTAADARQRLAAHADPSRVPTSQGFFKTGPGEYGEGDVFIGVRIPQIRTLVREIAPAMSLAEVRNLLASTIHEERVLALLVLVRQYERGDEATRGRIFDLYLKSTRWVNNWDLVDSSAAQIVGAHLADGDRSLLDRLAQSASLWERRIAMIATAHFIKRGDFDDALRIATTLVDDRHDLIQKAVGWMLREIGERDLEVEMRFLEEHAATMPRTMLRYAIEKLPRAERERLMALAPRSRSKGNVKRQQ